MRANLAELISATSLSRKDGLDRIKRHITEDRDISGYLSGASGNCAYWNGVVDDTVNSQFPEKNRPLIEIVANSVDAVQGRFPKDVAIEVTDRGFRVEDYGIGMDLDDVLVKLLIPTISGKEGQNTVGRFGVGFYSILSYLNAESDSVTVHTSDGSQSYSVEFSKQDDQIMVDINQTETRTQGTTASVDVEHFDQSDAKTLLTSTMRYNPNANVVLAGRTINNLEGFSRVVDDEAEVKILFSDSTSNGTGKISASVNGVTIFSARTEGQNLPSDVVIDYPVTTTLPVARNIVEVNAHTVAATKQIIDRASIQPNDFELFNALYPIVRQLQERNHTVESEHNLVKYLKQKVKYSIERGTTYLPDLPDFRKLEISDPVFVHPDLIAEETQRFDFERYAGFSSANALYLVDFQDDTVMLHHDHYVLLNRRFTPTTALEKAALQEYMGLEDVVGRFVEQAPKRAPTREWREPDGTIRDALFRRFFDEVYDGIVVMEDNEYERLEIWEKKGKDKLYMTAKKKFSKDELLQYLLGRLFQSDREIIAGLTTLPAVEKHILQLSPQEVLRYLGSSASRLSSVDLCPDFEDRQLMFHHMSTPEEEEELFQSRMTGIDTRSEHFLKDYLHIVEHNMEYGSGIFTDENILREYMLCKLLVVNQKLIGTIQDMDENNLRVFNRYYALLHNPREEAWQDQVDMGTLNNFPLLEPSLFSDERRMQSLDSLFSDLEHLKTVTERRKATSKWACGDYNEYFRTGMKLIEIDPELFSYFSDVCGKNLGEGKYRCFLSEAHKALFGNGSYGGKVPLVDPQDKKNAWKIMKFLDNCAVPTDQPDTAIFSGCYSRGEYTNLRMLRSHLDEVLDLFATPDSRPDHFFGFLESVTNLHTLNLIYQKRYEALELFEGVPHKLVGIWENIISKDSVEYRRVLQAFATLKYDVSSIQEVPRVIRPYIFYLQQDKSDEIVSLDEATSIEAAGCSHRVRLSHLFNGFLNSSEPIEVNGSLDCLDSLVAVDFTPQGRKYAARAVQHAINNQSSDQYIFIRELIQNSIDEAVSTCAPSERRQVDINTYQRGEDLVLGVRDQFGMDLDTVINYLLIPNNSTKKHDDELIGHFGQGFFTCLKESKEVQIKTSRGNGQTTYVRMTPLRDHKDKIMDVDIAITVQEGDYQGTEVQWVKQSEMKELDAAFIKSNVITYANLVDSEALRVNWHGSTVNRDKRLLSRKATAYGDISVYRLAGENTVTHRGLYLREIDTDYTQFMPAEVRDILLKHGIVIDLPKQVRLVKDRSDIALKQDYLAEMGFQIAAASLESTVQLFATGEIDLKCIPYDFVTRCSGRYSIERDIRKDVLRVITGQPVQFERYSDSTKLAKLLVSIPFAETRDGKKSLVECVRHLETGGSIDDLPEKVASYINQNRQQEQAIRDSQRGKLEEGYTEFTDLQLPATKSEMDTYWAFADFTSRAGRMIFETEYAPRDIKSTFYSKADGVKAHAYQQGNTIGWNILEADSYIPQFSRLLRGELSEDEQVTLLGGIVGTLTHELVHVGEQTMEWTHNEAFFRKQKKLLANSIRISNRIQSEMDRVVGNYQGTYADGKIFSESVSTN